MRLFKGFLIALAGLFIMITILSLFIPSRVTTVRSIMINASEDKIRNQVFNLGNWKNWHPVFMKDSAKIMTSQPPYGTNAFAEWDTDGKKNKIVFTEVTPSMARASLERKGENPVMNIISLVPINDSTGRQVEWRTLTKLKWYPWEKFAGIFVDEISGPGYEAALNNLKQYCEAR